MKLGQIENKSKGKGPSTWLYGGGLIAFLLALVILSHKGAFHINLPTFSSSSPEGIPSDQVPQYEEFAKKVAVSICNIGFHNVQTYLDDNSKYFSQDIMYDFQNSFFTTELQHQIVDQKLYCTAQNIQAIQTKFHGDQASFWFTGDMEYTSLLNNSSIHIPFSFRLVVGKFAEGFKVVGFYLATDQK